MKKTISLFFLIPMALLLCTPLLYGEMDLLKPHRMYIEGFFAMQNNNKAKNAINWNGKFNAYILANYYEAFLGLKGNKKNAIEAKNISFKVTPLLMQYPNNSLNPALSFYIGSFKNPLLFKMAHNPIVYKMRPTTKTHFFPALNAIKISKNKEHLGSAMELSLPFFNFYFFWKTHENRHSFNICSAYRNYELFSNTSKLNIATLFSFFQSNSNKTKANTNTGKKKKIKQNKTEEYIQIYGLSLNFESPFFHFNSLSLLSAAKKGKIDASSMSFRNEAGFRYGIFALSSGVTYRGRNYMGENAYKQFAKKNIISLYIQEKLKYKIFSLNCSYHLLHALYTSLLLHSYGIFYAINAKYIQFKNELFVQNSLYNIKAAFIVKPHLQYFTKMNISTLVCLQEKTQNPNIIKRYKISSYFLFPFGAHFTLKLSGAFSQEVEKKRIAQMRNIFFALCECSILFRQEKWREKLSISFKHSSTKKSELSIKLRIEY